jgi:hypothetical protein
MSRQFGVHDIERDQDPTIVVGRCYRGSLRIGDVFVLNDKPAGQSSQVYLTIAHIEAYRRSLDEIDEGLTARLTLQGQGGNTIVAGTILNT